MRLRRLGLLLATAVAAMALAPAFPASAALLIAIDKSKQQMTVTVDGDPLYVWPVSTGRAGYDTPAGAYTPFRMERDHFSREWDDAPMPHSIFFTQVGHAIHGTYEQKNLGRPVSHGCVRLSRANAATLWDLVKEQGKANTTVLLTGELPVNAGVAVARREPAAEPNYNDDDVTASAPPPRLSRNARGWREYDDAPRYYYGARPYYPPRRYYRYGGVPFPFPFGR
jgi:hypothetical protein